MEQLREKYYIGDGKIVPSAGFKGFDESTGIFIYEVLRVISGVPLFFEDHTARLQLSAQKSGFTLPVSIGEIEDGVRQLILQNQVEVGNIKIIVREYSGAISWLAFFIPFNYPSEADYLNGISLGILRAERKNPSAKTIQPDVREKAAQMIESGGLYEVLLINKNGLVTEGSRSNIFFVKGDTIFTPPTSLVLNGITRQKIIDILVRDQYSFSKEKIAFSDLPGFDSVFLTGTSPKVLSVKRIADTFYPVLNGLCSDISKKYDNLIADYILSHRQPVHDYCGQ